jgi:hypothetical protein
MAAVAFGVDVGDALDVAEEDAGRATVANGAPVPNFDGTVVAARGEDVGAAVVAVADGVDVLA